MDALQGEWLYQTVETAIPALLGGRLKCAHLEQSRFVCVCLGRIALLSHDVQTAKPANNDAFIIIKHTVFSQLI